MKSALALVILGVFVAVSQAENACPTYPANVGCFVDPCSANNCGVNEICCQDYSVGCNFQCIPTKSCEQKEEEVEVPFQCPVYPFNAHIRCFADPCQVNKCDAGKTCCSDYSVGCNFHCLS